MPPGRLPAVHETSRLALRRFTATDADAELVFELDSDPDVMRFIGPNRVPDAAAYRERIRTVWLPQDIHPYRGVFAIEDRVTGEFFGWVFLRPAKLYQFAVEAGWTRESDLELGYRLKRAAWGRGVATEASRALVGLAFEDPVVTAIVAAALKPNRASSRVMEKVGLSFVREFDIPGFSDPSVMYALCRAGSSPP
jgi:RimJ/RimL family protein N-acetyltransferase